MTNEIWDIGSWLTTAESPLKIIILYIIIQLVNVITSTLKSIILIKGSKTLATITNTLHYVVNAFAVALIGQVITNIPLVLIITAITNLVGVWVGLTIIDKLRKDQLWRISVTVKVKDYESLIHDLIENDIKFITLETDWDKVKLIDTFSHNREESQKLNEIFAKYDVKYTIYANSHNL